MMAKRWGRGASALLCITLWAGMAFASAPVAAQDPPADPPAAPDTVWHRITESIDAAFGKLNGYLAGVLFFDMAFGGIETDEVDRDGTPILDAGGNPQKKTVVLPFIVAFLFVGAIVFSFVYKFINIRAFRHAFDVTRGKYTDPNAVGEISHFRALTSALSATVGLGNIAGVAIAIQVGGPGAVFWMWICAVFGMTLKFSESTLAQLYRKKNPDGSISGGAMYYLDLGLREYGPVLGAFGKILAVFYALMIMAGAMGGGNMFQANQSFEAIVPTFGIPESSKAFASVVFGLIMAFMVGLVIIGGIKRIGAATSKIVPFMCGIYVLAAIFIMFWNIEAIPGTFGTIFSQAFGDNAFFGGIIGVAVMGIRRASFSNEAGLGSSAIAHAAAKTDEPVREGIVAMLEPFIDTIVVCSMTAFVVIVTDTYRAEAFWGVSDAGASMTVAAFDTVIPHFSYVLTICILLFAYSTMISWCYYGERGWIYLMDHFGEGTGLRTLLGFRVVFCMFVFFGSVIKLGQVLEFSDLVILCLAFPNLLGSMILLPKIVPIVNDYWRRFQAGEFKVYK